MEGVLASGEDEKHYSVSLRYLEPTYLALH